MFTITLFNHRFEVIFSTTFPNRDIRNMAHALRMVKVCEKLGGYGRIRALNPTT